MPTYEFEAFIDDIVITPETPTAPRPIIPIAGVGLFTQPGTGDVFTIPTHESNHPKESGKVLLIKSIPRVDFAQDLSTPSCVATWRVNQDIYDFTDNDDKQKMATIVTVKGKDILGKSISVTVKGRYPYDPTTMFFEDCAFVTRKSEGYIYKNSYATDRAVECTAIPGSTVEYLVGYPSGDKTKITVGASGFVNGGICSFTNPPDPLVDGTAYYIVDHTGNYIKVSATPGGSPISLKWMTYILYNIWEFSATGTAGNVLVYIKGVLAKTVACSNGWTGQQVATAVATAFSGGYVDGDGNTWTCSVNSVPYAYQVTFNAYSEGIDGTAITMTDGCYCSPNLYSYGNNFESVDLHATDTSIMQVDNSDGWFTEGMGINFSATTMPTGLDATTNYQVGGEIATTDDAIFFVMSGGYPVNFTTAGSDVVCYKLNTRFNFDENGNPAIWLYGLGYTIKTTDNLYISIPGVSITPIVSAGVPIAVTDVNGVVCTTVAVTTLPSIDYGGGKGYLLNERIYVSTNDLPGVDDDYFFIGEEMGMLSDPGTDPIYGDYLLWHNPDRRITGIIHGVDKKCYPHGVGALVMPLNIDTPILPDSPMDLYGYLYGNWAVDNNITFGDLDSYATALLLGKGIFYKKATCWGMIHDCFVCRPGRYFGATEPSVATPPRVGDRVEILTTSSATPEEYTVMGVTIKYDEGKILLELGDFEKNIFTTLNENTSGINRTLT